MSHPNPVIASYDRLAPIYDSRWHSYEEATLHATLEALSCRPGQRLLDLACGTAELERLLLARDPELCIVGLDLSTGMLKHARAKGVCPRITLMQADAHRLPLADATFDWVICASSFHYFRQPQVALREMRRVLRPDGRLVLVDWCDDYLTCKLCGWWLCWTDPAYFRMYGVEECQALLVEAGFHVLDRRQFRADWLWGLMRFVCRRLGD